MKKILKSKAFLIILLSILTIVAGYLEVKIESLNAEKEGLVTRLEEANKEIITPSKNSSILQI